MPYQVQVWDYAQNTWSLNFTNSELAVFEKQVEAELHANELAKIHNTDVAVFDTSNEELGAWEKVYQAPSPDENESYE